MELNIDKTGWKKVKFGEVCRQVNETARNHEEEELTHVVGLEHIGSNDLHIRSWNTPERETTFTRKFVKGQVLFGRRRAYQAKVAYAEFDGICSGDILVFEAIKSKLLPELLPFMVQSQKFYNKAVETSAGSLSPRTKFKDLADLEFLLPPKGQQACLAELLWAADEVVEREMEVKKKLENIFEISKTKLLWSNSFPMIDFKDITPIGLKDGDWIESKDQSDSGIRLIQLADIGEGFFLDKSNRFISEDTFKKLHCFEIKPRDILLARMPDPIGRSCIMPHIKTKSITAVDVCIIRIDEGNSNVEYVNYLINTIQLRSKIIELSSGTTRQRISKLNLGNIKIPMPSKLTQDRIANQISVVEQNLKSLIYNIDFSNRLKQGFINEIF